MAFSVVFLKHIISLSVRQWNQIVFELLSEIMEIHDQGREAGGVDFFGCVRQLPLLKVIGKVQS